MSLLCATKKYISLPFQIVAVILNKWEVQTNFLEQFSVDEHNMNRQHKHQSKLVAVLTKKITILNEGLKSPKERIDMIEDVFMDLIKNLTTFGPILKVIHDEYQRQFTALKKNLFIEEILRQKYLSICLL